LTDKASKDLEEAVAAAKAEAETNALKEQKDNLLLLSQFLKLAAIRRGEDEAAELEESKALEGLLAQVYGGDATAVAAMLNLIQGSSETITSVNSEALTVTCKSSLPIICMVLASHISTRCRHQGCITRSDRRSPCCRRRDRASTRGPCC
jgi:hypothetical protein